MLDFQGRPVNKNLSKYLIEWNGKSLSKVQYQAKQFLKDFWSGHVVTEEFRIPGSRLSCDFLNWSLKIAIEIDGKFHNVYSSFHHRTKFGFLASLKRDESKDQWLEKNGFIIGRIGEAEVKNLSYGWVRENLNIDLLENYS